MFRRQTLWPALFCLGWVWWDLPSAWILLQGKSAVWALDHFGLYSEGLLKMVWFAGGLALVAMSYPRLVELFWAWPKWVRSLFHGGYGFLATLGLPFLSRDMLSYIAEAQLSLRHHFNPLTTAPAAVPGWRHDYWLVHAGWVHKVSPYGPFWAWWESFSGHLFHPFWQQFIWIKASNLVMVGVCAYVLGRMAGRVVGLRFWLHPLVGLELLASGHNDSLLILLMVLGYEAYQKMQYRRFAGFWAMATGVKFIPLALLPILLAGLTLADQGVVIAIGASVLASAYLPYWQGWITLIAPWQNQSMFLRSFDFMIEGGLSHIWPGFRTTYQHIATATGLSGFAAVLAHSSRRWLRQRRDPSILGHTLVLLALIALSWFQYWYLTWSLPFYLLSARASARRVVAWLTWVEAIRMFAWPRDIRAADSQILQFLAIWLSLGLCLGWTKLAPLVKHLYIKEERWS